METNNSNNKSSQVRYLLNERRFALGESISLSIVQIISLFVINISIVSIVLNLFIKGTGPMEWWSGYVAGILIFAYLVLRIFTSSGVMLGRQVTLLITVFNIFLNLFKFFNMVKPGAVWELTFVIPLVNLLCMAFLIIAFMIRRKKFRTIIMPSLKIILVSIIPIVRLKLRLDDGFYLPVFATFVLLLSVALFLNSLILNWLTIRKEAEKNFEILKKGANDFKKFGDKAATVNRVLENVGKNVNKAKGFVNASTSAVKEFFSFKKKVTPPDMEVSGEPLPITNESSAQDEPTIIEYKEKRTNKVLKQVRELAVVKKALNLLKKKPSKEAEVLSIKNVDERELVLSDIDNTENISDYKIKNQKNED